MLTAPTTKNFMGFGVLNHEKVVVSEHKKIMILYEDNQQMNWAALKSAVKDLLKISENLDSREIQLKLKQLLPDYIPRSFMPLTEEDRMQPFTIKGQA